MCPPLRSGAHPGACLQKTFFLYSLGAALYKPTQAFPVIGGQSFISLYQMTIYQGVRNNCFERILTKNSQYALGGRT